MIPDNLRIDVGKTYSTFKVWKNESWVLAGQEYTLIFDGTKKMRASSRTVEQFTEDENIRIIRTSNFKNNVTVIDTYTFDGNEKDIELFPISHKINVLNGEEYILVYEVTKLEYSGETTKDILSPQEFGHNMKIEWEEGNYYSRIWKYASKDEGKFTIKYRPDSNNFTKQVRLFDPPRLNSTSNSISLSPYKVFNGWKVFVVGNESVLFDVTLIKDQVCMIPKFSGTIRRNESYMDFETEKMVERYTNYTQPNTLKLTLKNKTTSQLTKVDNKFCYTINKSESLFYKFGESSVILEGDTSFDSIDNNIIQETGFSHLNISNTTPYDSNVLYMPFDSNVSTTITFDYTENNNDGTINGAIFNETGKYGGAFEFDGVDDFIEINSDGGLSAYPFTMSAWITSLSNDGGAIVDLADASEAAINYRIQIQPTGEASAAVRNGGASERADSTTLVNDGKWHYITGVFLSSTNRTIYVNGVSEATNVVSRTFNTNTDVISVGRLGDSTPGSFFNGSIDEVMIFNTSLNASQILDIFNNQSARFFNTGTQLFNNTNVSTDGTENRLNISLTDYQNLLGSNISVSVNDNFFNLSSAGIINNLEFTDDPNSLNITFRYLAGTNNFYSPLIIGNITLDSWTEAADTCTYTSGNWDVTCSDNCTINSNVNLNGNNLTLSNDNGTFNVRANISNFDKIMKYLNCQINIFNGGFNK